MGCCLAVWKVGPTVVQSVVLMVVLSGLWMAAPSARHLAGPRAGSTVVQSVVLMVVRWALHWAVLLALHWDLLMVGPMVVTMVAP